MDKEDIHKDLVIKICKAKEIVRHQSTCNLYIMRDAIINELEERGA